MADKQELLSDIDYNEEISLSDDEADLHLGDEYNGNADEESIDIDEYLKRGGECGRFQIMVEAILLLSMLPTVFPIMSFYYLGVDPKWKCSENILHNKNSFCSNSTGITYEHTNKARCELNRTEWSYAFSGRSTIVTEFDLVCDRAWLDALNGSILFIGWGMGSLLLGTLSDKFGRKRVMYPSFFMCLVCLFLHTFVQSINQLLTVRFLMGFFYASPALNTVILLLEIIGPNKRVYGNAVATLLWPIGAFVLTMKAYYIKDWRKLAMYCSAPYFVGIFLGIFVPESVRWLNLQGRTKEAEKILRRAARMNKRTISPLVSLKPAAGDIENNNKKKSASYWDLFGNCKILKIVLAQAFLWFNCGMTYYTLSWAFADLGGDMYLNFLLSFIVEIPSSFISMVAIQRFGRCRATFVCNIFLVLSCLGVACIPKTDQFKIIRVTIGLFGKFMISNVFNAIYVWSSEIYPTAVRSQGMGINIITSRAGAATSPFIKVLDSLHPAAPFGLLTVTSIIASLCILVLPETLNKPTRETMADMLQEPLKEVQMRAVFTVNDETLKINDNRLSINSEDLYEMNDETDQLIIVPPTQILPDTK